MVKQITDAEHIKLLMNECKSMFEETETLRESNKSLRKIAETYHETMHNVSLTMMENARLEQVIERLEGRDEFHQYAINQWLTYEKDTKKDMAELRAELQAARDEIARDRNIFIWRKHRISHYQLITAWGLIYNILDDALSYGEYILTKEDMINLAAVAEYELPEE